MKIGILLLSLSELESLKDVGQFDAVFTRWLKTADPSIQTQSWFPPSGEMPPSPDVCDAWILTGSLARIVDPDPWQEELENFIRQAHIKKIKIYATCYGHQSIARALGGEVEASPHGFQCGLRSMKLNKEGQAFFGTDFLTIHQSHNDRVKTLPPGGVLLGSHDLCEIEAMRVENHMFSFQGHPEFSLEMIIEDIDKSEGKVSAEQTKQAHGMLKGPHDGPALAQHVINFFKK